LSVSPTKTKSFEAHCVLAAVIIVWEVAYGISMITPDWGGHCHYRDRSASLPVLPVWYSCVLLCSQFKDKIVTVLNFTALLIEHSYARHIYNSTEVSE